MLYKTRKIEEDGTAPAPAVAVGWPSSIPQSIKITLVVSLVENPDWSQTYLLKVKIIKIP